jgi:hypothetical protein
MNVRFIDNRVTTLSKLQYPIKYSINSYISGVAREISHNFANKLIYNRG